MNQSARRWSFIALIALFLLLPNFTFAASHSTIRRAVQTDGQYVVWLESSSEPYAQPSLVAGKIQRDGTIDDVQVLTDEFWAPVNQVSFDLIGGGIVSWIEVHDNTTTIFMRDLNAPDSTNTVLTTLPQSTSVSVPSVASRRIVWREGKTIKRYDVAKAATTTIATNPKVTLVSDPQISGGWIVWATQTQAQLDDPRLPASLMTVSASGKIVKTLDSMECGQVCFYHLSGNRVLYTATQQTMAVRDIVLKAVIRDNGTSSIHWDLVDGAYVFDRHQPTAYHLGDKRTVALPFTPTDVRDGWMVGLDADGEIQVARIRDIDRRK